MLHIYTYVLVCSVDSVSKTVQNLDTFVFVCMQESTGVVRWLISSLGSLAGMCWRVRQCLDLIVSTFFIKLIVFFRASQPDRIFEKI